jgi:hypothetical protein
MPVVNLLPLDGGSPGCLAIYMSIFLKALYAIMLQ